MVRLQKQVFIHTVCRPMKTHTAVARLPGVN